MVRLGISVNDGEYQLQGTHVEVVKFSCVGGRGGGVTRFSTERMPMACVQCDQMDKRSVEDLDEL